MSHNVVDRADSVRIGEELNTEAVDDWLKSSLSQQALTAPNTKLTLEGKPKVTQYAGGASNWTYCLDYENTSLILRRALQAPKQKVHTIWGENIACKKRLNLYIAMYLKCWGFVMMKASLELTFMLWRSSQVLFPEKSA